MPNINISRSSSTENILLEDRFYEDESDDGDATDESDFDEALTTTLSRTKSNINEGANYRNHLIVETSFDAYFIQTAARVNASSNVFSQLVAPLSAEEHREAISKLQPVFPSNVLLETVQRDLFPRFITELNEGFNLLCHGFGSKRSILNHFAISHCSKRGHVVVINTFHPDFNMRDLLSSVEKIPGIHDLELSSSTPEKQARRICDFFSRSSEQPHLYLIIHNIDASPLRTVKSKSILSMLAMSPGIHIVASVDHINSPLLWTTSESSTRKWASRENEKSSARGFSWLWHDLTTLAPYDFELSFTEKTSISGAHGGGPRRKTDAVATQNSTAMSETAALHILASVTQKAQKLFSLLGSKQLDNIGETANSTDLQQFGMGYDALFNLARDNFVATNETAMRALMGEFKDHGLILTVQSGSAGSELLWIPLRKERLENVLQQLKAE